MFRNLVRGAEKHSARVMSVEIKKGCALVIYLFGDGTETEPVEIQGRRFLKVPKNTKSIAIRPKSGRIEYSINFEAWMRGVEDGNMEIRKGLCFRCYS